MEGLVPRLRAREEGFTLAEVIIAIAILGIVSGALAAAFITTGRSSVGVAARFSLSHDAQIASAYLATDVQSDATIAGGSCTSGSAVIAFDYGNGSVASYCAGGSKLTREFSGASPTSATLVHNLSGTPGLSCDTGACAIGSKPKTVSITVTTAASGTSSYTFVLTGSRRQFESGCPNPQCDNGNPLPDGTATLLTLATGPSAPGLQLGGSATLKVVNGYSVVDSSSASGACGTTPPLSAVCIGGNNTASFGTELQIVSPGVCTGPRSMCPTPPTLAPRRDPMSDPFQGLAAPPPSATVTCTIGVTTTQCPAGTYTNTLVINRNTHLASGVYVLQNGFSIQHGTVTGDNVLLYITGGSFLVSGGSGNTSNCGGVTPAAAIRGRTGATNAVLTKATTTTTTVPPSTTTTTIPPSTTTTAPLGDGSNTDPCFTLTGLSAPGIDGFLIWQPASNTNAAIVAGQSGSYGLGKFYFPAAAVKFGGQGSLAIGSVIAQSINVAGSSAAKLCVGARLTICS